MSKQEEAGLILKLYELRREEKMRVARDWYFRDFHPQSVEEFHKAISGEHSAHLRMVVSYWDMAAALVNNGAIGMEMFNDANGEHMGVFSKIEPLLPEINKNMPGFARNLSRLIDAMPEGRKRSAGVREQMKAMRERMAQGATRTA